MALLKSFFSRRVQPLDSDAGQTLPQKMNLEERMAYRRDMLFEAIGVAMDSSGFSEESYRIRVSRIDKRGHIYAVMISLGDDFLNDSRASQAALRPIGKNIVATAGSSGLLQVTAVYWSVEEQSAGFKSADVEATVLEPVSERARLLDENWAAKLEQEQRIYASDIAPLS